MSASIQSQKAAAKNLGGRPLKARAIADLAQMELGLLVERVEEAYRKVLVEDQRDLEAANVILLDRHRERVAEMRARLEQQIREIPDRCGAA